MTIGNITKILIKLHQRYARTRHSNETSQMCTFWSTDDPPSTLEFTKQFDDICESLNYDFTEDEAVLFYDMEIKEAAEYIFALMQESSKD